MTTIKEKVKGHIPTLMVFHHDGNKDAFNTAEVVEELRTKYAGKANIEPYDCTHNGQVKVEYHLHEYPSFVLFKEGQELMRESGKKSIAQLSDMIDRAL